MHPGAAQPIPDVPRPPLKWAGGKRWQVPVLRSLWAPHASRRLVEPFCGGLSVALGLQPAHALLNDVNPHLVSFYRWLKRGFRPSVAFDNDPHVYYRHRRRFNQLLADGRGRTLEAASLFYFLNRTGYNGLCRFNQRGQFNVPYGRYARIAYRRDFAPYRDALANWSFRSGDFGRVPLEPDDFVYADPPYDVPFTAYSQGGFAWQDQVRAARRFAHHPGPVVLVNQATDRIVSLYRECGYALEFLAAPRRISCTGDRTPAREVMATRNL
jgi:DNA adenine methylase